MKFLSNFRVFFKLHFKLFVPVKGLNPADRADRMGVVTILVGQIARHFLSANRSKRTKKTV
jgi:hypothetical protein